MNQSDGSLAWRVGVSSEVLVMGGVLPRDFSILKKNLFTVVVSSLVLLEQLEELAVPLNVHLQFDTGMGRYGVSLTELDLLVTKLQC